MERNLSDLTDPVILSDNNIRIVQTTLQSKLASFRKKISDATFEKTYNICENVRDKVLNSEDEPQLSKTQNNFRRISVASELLIDICSLYEYVVDCEFSRIIDNLMQWEKYKYISINITKKIHLQSKKEKYFAKEAQSKLLKCSEEDKASGAEKETTPRHSETIEGTNLAQGQVKDISAEELIVQRQPFKEQDQEGHKELFKELELVEKSHTDEFRRSVLEYSARGNFSNATENFTELHPDSITNLLMLQQPTFDQREVELVPSAIPELLIRKSTLQGPTEDNISQILEILKEDTVDKQIIEIEKPEAKSTDISREPFEDIIIEQTQALNKNQIDSLEDWEEWSLPALEPLERPQKKSQLIVDPVITIHNYSRRALHLNSNIKIQRVQVFEGPPDVLNAMSANHLMGSPGFKGSVFRDLRSSMLSKLFKRHLIVEQKPVEPRSVPVGSTIGKAKDIDISKIRGDEEIVEEIGMKAEMRSLPVQPEALEKSITEKRQMKDTVVDFSPNVLGKESLIGVPVSRIFGPEIQPPDLEGLNNMSGLVSPRVQQLQGKTLDPETHSSWFHSTRQNPPNTKYKEFSYVYKKIQDYWLLSEIQGMEKSITLKEFFRFEVDGGIENFLTVLRIIDKLSVQRKLLLEYKNQDVLIRPFEFPFVSKKHLLIGERKPN